MGTTQIKDGFDGGSDSQLLVNPDGSINTNVSGSVIISGPVEVTQGTDPWIISGSVLASQDGSWTVDVGNFPASWEVTQGTDPWIVSGTVAATQSGAWSVGRTWVLSNVTDSVNVGNFPGSFSVTQGTSPWIVSGAVTANIGTTGGLALDATLDETHGSATGGTAALQSDLVGGIYNTSPLTLTNNQQASLQLDVNGNLKTTAVVTVPGTVSVTQGTTPWVDNISQFGGNAVVTGTGASGVGIPRVTVSNDSNILATQSGTWNINNISGTISLPTGASTSANQTTANSSLSSIDGKLNSLGQKTMANSMPIVIASNQSTVPVSITESINLTYSAASIFTSAATPTDVFTITGSATKTVKIRSISISAVNTGNTNILVVFAKRSTANSGGTSTTLTAVPHTSADAAATATTRSYTANPTLGSLVGNVGANYIFAPALASTNKSTPAEFIFNDSQSKPITLLGTSEVFSINLNGATIGGTTTLAIDIVWTEE